MFVAMRIAYDHKEELFLLLRHFFRKLNIVDITGKSMEILTSLRMLYITNNHR